MRKELLVYGSPAIENAEIEEVVAVMQSGWLGTGPRVAQFERDFAEYKGIEHAVALNSCTAALHLSILAAGIGPGDEVIVPAVTFIASASAVLMTNAVPVFADILEDTCQIDPADIESKITPRTKAIVVVHYGGYSVDMDAILAIAG